MAALECFDFAADREGVREQANYATSMATRCHIVISCAFFFYLLATMQLTRRLFMPFGKELLEQKLLCSQVGNVAHGT